MSESSARQTGAGSLRDPQDFVPLRLANGPRFRNTTVAW